MALPIARDSDNTENETFDKTYIKDGVEYIIAESTYVHRLLSTDPQYLKQYLDTNLNALEISDVSVTRDQINNIEPVADEFSWTGQTTKLLLSLYQERKRDFRNPKIKKKKLWSEICEKFYQRGYKNISENCLDRKMRNMKKTYRTIKDNNKKSTTGKGRISWEYFDSFEEIFQDDCTINIGSTLSSLNEIQKDVFHDTENLDPLSCNSEHYQFCLHNPYPINSRSPSPLSLSPSISLSLAQLEESQDASSSEPNTTPHHHFTQSGNKSTKHKGLYSLRREQIQLEEKRVKVLQDLVISINTANAIQQNRNELLEALIKDRNNRKEKDGL